MAIDRADYHFCGEFPADLPPENGGTHIGMFLAWAILHNLQGEFHDAESPAGLAAVRQRAMTGREFLFQSCDGKLWEEDLNSEGNTFAASYYSGPGGEGYGAYIGDYEKALAEDLDSTYEVADTWDNYDVIAVVIDTRYAEWVAAKVK